MTKKQQSKKVTKMPAKKAKKSSVKKKNTSKKFSFSSLDRKALIIIAVVVFALVGAWFIKGSFAATSYTLYWSDEFNGTSVNTANWGVYNNTYGEGNKEEACLTPNNVTVSNGTLKLTAKRQDINCQGNAAKFKSFTSGFIATRSIGSTDSGATAQGKYFPGYAKYEVRAKLPHGQGLWPAFWLRHKDGAAKAEVDIMEYFHAQVPGKTTGTLHYNDVANVSKKTASFETPTTTPAWHTWAVEMEDTSSGVLIKWLLDGTVYHQYTVTDKSQFTKYKDTFDIALNLAVGGTYSGHPDDALGYSRYLGKCLKPYNGSQPCDASGILRANFDMTYEIDYVRVYTKTTTTNPVVTPPAPTPAPAKLATPSNLKAAVNDGSVVLTWDKVEGANNYTVRWGKNGSWTNYSNDTGLTNPTTNSYTITGLTNGTVYDFSVAARDSTGKSTGSDYAATINATPAPQSLQVPQNVKVTPGNGKLTVQWDKSTDSRVDQYSVRYIKSNSSTKTNGSTWTYPGRTSSVSSVLYSLRNDTSYDVQVRSVDNKGTSSTSDDTYSAYSSVITATPKR
jgi:beta-glucanase (GH16 family)